MAIRVEKAVPASQFPEKIGFWKDFALVCYEGIGNRHNKQGEIPFVYERDKIDHATNLFPTEKRLTSKLLEECAYLPETDREMVKTSLALMFNAHQGEYRDGGQPYSTHTLKSAINLVKKYRVDTITICADLLHDTVEDTHVTLDEIRMNIHPEVAETVDALTRIRARYQRRALADETSRLRIAKSLVDNPRVALIKISGDRLHNIHTLGAKRGRARRLKIIDETRQIYIPLARRMGLFVEANELEVLCLANTSKEHAVWVKKTSKFMKKFFQKLHPETIADEVRAILQGPSIRVIARVPSVADIYNRIGELRDVSSRDMYLLLDVIHDGFQLFQENDMYLRWGQIAMSIANLFSWNRNYRRAAPLDVLQFRQEIESHLTDSLTFHMTRIPNSLNLKATVYPKDVYENEQASLAGLYNYAVTEEGKGLRKRAFMKWGYLRRKFEPILKGEVVSSQLVRQLEPRLAEGFMRVIGVNDEGVEEPWSVRTGTTVMDYDRDIAPANFNTAYRVDVTAKDGKTYEDVVPNYVLQPGDKIHIFFDKTARRWDPMWIHCFVHDTEGKSIVQKNIRRLLLRLKHEKNTAEFEKLRNRIIKIGEWKVEQSASIKPLREDERLAMSVIREILPEMQTQREFLFTAGLGEVSEDNIRKIAARLSEVNREIQIVRVYFQENLESQAKAVSAVVADMDINLLDIGSNGKRSYMSLYLDPSDKGKIRRLVQTLLVDRGCREVGIKYVTLSQNISGAREKYYFLRR